jgi:hypothetical protein
VSRSPKSPETKDFTLPTRQGQLLADAQGAFKQALDQFNLVFSTIAAGVGLDSASLVSIVKKNGKWIMTTQSQNGGKP